MATTVVIPTPADVPVARGETRVGGRFLTRPRLATRSLYWTGWLIISGGSKVGSGVQREIDTLGVGALRLVTAASILVGLIATFQIAYQLSEYSAQMMSARAIGWFGARELGPVVVAILIIARSASRIAGEFASMSVNAEIDALRAMGLDPVKYLVAPKIAALIIVIPALTILSDGLIAIGGWVGNTMFLGFTTGFYLEQFRTAFTMRDLTIGLVKAVIFALIVGLVAADEGLNVERRVSAISEAATRTVVMCLIAVLAFDTLVNAIFYFIPGLI
jgi:phospholipid/cholesterol/gamma-HCH transport system permease protein